MRKERKMRRIAGNRESRQSVLEVLGRGGKVHKSPSICDLACGGDVGGWMMDSNKEDTSSQRATGPGLSGTL